MKKPSPLKEKSFLFGTQILELTRRLKESKTEYILCRQLLRSGTAIGAMVREAEFAQSKADFINKFSIALKEANETDYWINMILADQPYLEIRFHDTMRLLTEILKMLVSSIKTAKEKSTGSW
jgi:four helix bundle protein